MVRQLHRVSWIGDVYHQQARARRGQAVGSASTPMIMLEPQANNPEG